MKSRQWKEVEQIVDTAFSMDAPEREEYIEEACDSNDIKKEVTELLASIETSRKKNYLQESTPYQELKSDLSKLSETAYQASLIGKQIGRYKVIDLIGHGGMGSVYLAHRSDGSYQQHVAIKLLRQGMDTPSNVKRFEQERQILAQFNHPNIAQLFDGGITNNGLPYLVMEYVNGISLLEYCNKHHLSIDNRLELFRQICRAIQYAHANAVIHRDLKPSNILVGDEEDIKILDFGIAKLLAPTVPGTTLFRTQTKSRILTLGYAAPEQISNHPITTAVDTYALGILLYELLAGVHPFDLEGKTHTEVEQILQEQLPTKPSARFANLAREQQDKIAEQHNTSIASLTKTLRGDLDAIIMKALRKEPKSRFTSAEQFHEDIQRYQTNQPITARGDAFQYKSKKFLKRHKWSLSVAATFLLFTIVFVVFHTWQITQERNQAQLEAEKAQATTNFLTDLIKSNHPANAQGDTISVREFLDQGFSKVQTLNENPIIKAEIMQVMGYTYRSLGENDKAKELITKSLALLEDENASIFDKAITHDISGLIFRDLGKLQKASEHLYQAITLFEKSGKTETQEYAKSLRNLAYVEATQEKFSSAENHIRKAIDVGKNVSETESSQLAESYYVFASILRRQEKFKQALDTQKKSYAILQRTVKGPNPGKMVNLNNLGIIYRNIDSTKKAIDVYQKALGMNKELYGSNHSSIAIRFNNLATLYEEEQRLDVALTYSDSTMQVAQSALSKDHPLMSLYLLNRAEIFKKSKEHQTADPLYKRAYDITKKHFKPTHTRRLTILNNWGENARQLHDYQQSIRLLTEAFTNYDSTAAFDNDLKEDITSNLAKAHRDAGNTNIADSLLNL